MAKPSIPRADAAALSMFRVFAGAISANYSLYGLSAADAAAIQTAVNSFDSASRIASDEATRTRVTICSKDNARISAEQIVRQFYSLIKPNAGVSDADKIAIGINPLNRSRQRMHCPASSPAIYVIGATPNCHTIRYHDTTSPTTSRRPFGAVALQLFVAISDSRVTDAEQARYCGSYTRNPVGVEFRSENEGKIATYFGRWIGRRGDAGSWSLPVSMRIAA